MAFSKEYIENLKNELLDYYGVKCKRCGSTTDLQFAHTKPTGLNGAGRGKYRRLRDVKNNLDCYTLLCDKCHKEFDSVSTGPDTVPF